MAEETKILDKSPNPDKLENKLQQEVEWAQKLMDKDSETCSDAFMKQLSKLDNPIQIWIKSQALKSLDCECYKDYEDKAKELGFNSDMMKTVTVPKVVGNGIIGNPVGNIAGIHEAVNVTKFADGTYVFSTKNKEIIEKMNELAQMLPSQMKQVFQYPNTEDKVGTMAWDMFHQSVEDIKAEKPEFDSTALFNLINNNHFLKFTYHNLMTGDTPKDLEMMWKDYVKNDDVLMKQLKVSENYVSYDERTSSVKFNWFNVLNESINKVKISKDLNINKYSFEVNSLISKTKTLFESILPELKIEWRNLAYSLDTYQLAEKISEMHLSFIQIDTNVGIYESLNKSIKLSNDISSCFYHGPILECTKKCLKHLYIGSKDTSNLFNITLSIVLKEACK